MGHDADTFHAEMAAALRSDDQQASDVTEPYFSVQELQAMHRWCLKYRDLVRGGGIPTPVQDRRFMAYQTATHWAGVANA